MCAAASRGFVTFRTKQLAYPARLCRKIFPNAVYPCLIKLDRFERGRESERERERERELLHEEEKRAPVIKATHSRNCDPFLLPHPRSSPRHFLRKLCSSIWLQLLRKT